MADSSVRRQVAGLPVLERGVGDPPIVLVHGSAAEHTTWGLALPAMAAAARCIRYDRRGAGASPLPLGERIHTVADHAAELAEVIVATDAAPALVCGSSFGAVIALDLARSRPDLVAALVLCEPPMHFSDYGAGTPYEFVCHMDRLIATHGGHAAGELFLRIVMTDAVFEGLPARWRARICGSWRQIRADVASLAVYRPHYHGLARVRAPTLLLGGDRSNPFFEDTLCALARTLPNARRVTIANAGHMMHVEAARAFAREVLAFRASLPQATPQATVS